MRRILLVLAIGAMMAVMLVGSAGSALAQADEVFPIQLAQGQQVPCDQLKSNEVLFPGGAPAGPGGISAVGPFRVPQGCS